MISTNDIIADRPADGLFSRPGEERSDLWKVARAIKRRWPVKSSTRALAIKVAEELLESDDDRVKVAAIAALLRAEDANQKDQHKVYDGLRGEGLPASVNNNIVLKIEYDKAG